MLMNLQHKAVDFRAYLCENSLSVDLQKKKIPYLWTFSHDFRLSVDFWPATPPPPPPGGDTFPYQNTHYPTSQENLRR